MHKIKENIKIDRMWRLMVAYIITIFALIAVACVVYRLNVIIPVLMGLVCILYKFMLKHKVKTYNCVHATCIDFMYTYDIVFFKHKYSYRGKYQYELNGEIYTHIDKWYHRSPVELQIDKTYKIYVKNDNPKKCYSEIELQDRIYYYGALFCFICALIIVHNNIIFS